MNFRIKVLREKNIRIENIREAVADMEPLPGAVEMLKSLHALCPRLIILTDTFEDYAMPMFKQLGDYTAFCHSLKVDADGFIEKHVLRLTDQKRKAVEALKGLNFKCIAVGDSFNDISMLKAADVGILFRPSDNVKKAHPEFPVIVDHNELTHVISDVLLNGKVPRTTPLTG